MEITGPVASLRDYCRERGLTLGRRLGFGVHGTVFMAENQTKDGVWAVKAFDQEHCYLRERDVYLRLRQLGIRQIHCSTIPTMTGYDDGRWVIEMTVVSRPFVLDFAKGLSSRLSAGERWRVRSVTVTSCQRSPAESRERPRNP